MGKELGRKSEWEGRQKFSLVLWISLWVAEQWRECREGRRDMSAKKPLRGWKEKANFSYACYGNGKWFSSLSFVTTIVWFCSDELLSFHA